MTTDEAKEEVIKACGSVMEMDLRAMAPSLKRWGMRVADFERMDGNIDAPNIVNAYLVWLVVEHDIAMGSEHIRKWLEDLDDWPWVGTWYFTVNWHKPDGKEREWNFEVRRVPGIEGWSTTNVDVSKVKWPER